MEENLNIKRFLEAQHVAKATHHTLHRASSHVIDIEAKMKELAKKSLKRPTRDLRRFR